VLVLDMIEILPPLGKYKYDTWRILPVKCYIDNSVHLWSCIRNINMDGVHASSKHHIRCSGQVPAEFYIQVRCGTQFKGAKFARCCLDFGINHHQ
jgi:hypothetical protein